MYVPVLNDLVGDPAGVRVEVRRLVDAAESMGSVGRNLSDLNQQAVQAWESNAQRMFSTLADTVSQVIGGSGAVASDMAVALDRYANTLDVCQGDVRVCRQRLQSLVTSTPAGMVPDPAAVNTIVGQANEAYARAGQAARDLSAAALNLMGNPAAHGSLPAPGDASASFVSHAHTAGLASGHPSAAAFDVQSGHIQSQMNGVMTSLGGLASTAPGANSGSAVVVDPSAVPSVPLRIWYTGQQAPTLTVQSPGSSVSNPQDLVMVQAPYSAGGYGGSLGILVDTSIKRGVVGPDSMAASEGMHSLFMLDMNASGIADVYLENMRDRPNAFDYGIEDDTYKGFLDLNDDRFDNI
jgi:hypothetical protein